MTQWFDVTLSREAMSKNGMTEDALQSWLKAKSSKWAYGRETGDSAYEHLQLRAVFPQSMSMGEMQQVFAKVGHVSYTHARDFDYVLKDGNAVLSWKMPLYKFASATLKIWQTDAKSLFSMQSDREILVIIDPVGGAGKSFLAKHMEACGLAKVIPKMSRSDDMISAAMVNPADGYIFDIPRAEEKRSVSLWSAIEQIKSGHLYDWRYQYREVWIESPKIMVFTNTEPPWDYLSLDRWKILRLEGESPEKQIETVTSTETPPWGTP